MVSYYFLPALRERQTSFFAQVGTLATIWHIYVAMCNSSIAWTGGSDPTQVYTFQQMLDTQPLEFRVGLPDSLFLA